MSYTLTIHLKGNKKKLWASRLLQVKKVKVKPQVFQLVTFAVASECKCSFLKLPSSSSIEMIHMYIAECTNECHIHFYESALGVLRRSSRVPFKKMFHYFFYICNHGIYSLIHMLIFLPLYTCLCVCVKMQSMKWKIFEEIKAEKKCCGIKA